mmetsp:Transcript_39671/g.126780  ORF Transcript_39671/g.126780 Transcript_39671/m.126780 type:complete len:272 (-) Transcript_39671:1208-2023(-)
MGEHIGPVHLRHDEGSRVEVGLDVIRVGLGDQRRGDGHVPHVHLGLLVVRPVHGGEGVEVASHNDRRGTGLLRVEGFLGKGACDPGRWGTALDEEDHRLRDTSTPVVGSSDAVLREIVATPLVVVGVQDAGPEVASVERDPEVGEGHLVFRLGTPVVHHEPRLLDDEVGAGRAQEEPHEHGGEARHHPHRRGLPGGARDVSLLRSFFSFGGTNHLGSWGVQADGRGGPRPMRGGENGRGLVGGLKQMEIHQLRARPCPPPPREPSPRMPRP